MLRSTIILLTVLIAIAGCKKRDNGGTFTVTGRWIKDCSGAAHANEPIHLGLRIEGFNQKDNYDNIGSGVTDANGNFSIACQNHGSGILILSTGLSSSFGGAEFHVLGGDGNLDDLGTFYDSYTSGAKLRFVFAQPHSDTLFVGDKSQPDFYVYPAQGSYTIQRYRTGSIKAYPSYQAHYGFGRADYDRPVNSGDSRIILKENAFQPCSDGEVTVINIP